MNMEHQTPTMYSPKDLDPTMFFCHLTISELLEIVKREDKRYRDTGDLRHHDKAKYASDIVEYKYCEQRRRILFRRFEI